MTNFDFLRGDTRFASFSGAAAAAETIYPIDTAACAVNVRRALELTVKWMFETDKRLTEPKRTSLASLLAASSFRTATGKDLSDKLEFIRRIGNNAAHHPDSVTKEQAELSLRYLFDFANFVAKRYEAPLSPYPFDQSLLQTESEIVTEAIDSTRIAQLIKENRTLKRLLRAQSAAHDTGAHEEEGTSTAPLNEAATRRLYIEADLTYAGWKIGVDCLCEYPIKNLEGGSGVGYADYVLFDKNAPLAIVEAQAAGEDPAIGRQQAKLYADALEKKHGIRPILFLTDGADTRIWQDRSEAERKIAGLYSKADLLRLHQMLKKRAQKKSVSVPEGRMPDRAYQKEAVHAVLHAFCEEKKRTATISMAPATGKTRTALAAAQAMYDAGFAQSILYLTESDLLVRQVLRECESTTDLRAASLFDGKNLAMYDFLAASYDEILADADDLYDKNGAHLFTPGHFDLILCDEADRRITEKYRDIFETFDARTLFLTSTPGTEEAVFAYTHEQAVKDGFIAPMRAMNLRTAAMETGITPADLEHGVRRDLENQLRRTGQRTPKKILPQEMFTEYYNDGTVRLMLETLCREGITKGGLPEKTILFTENHFHSEMIYEVWNRLYPAAPPHFCRVIDLATNYTDSLLRDFSDSKKMPYIAISHDLLLDGVDIPSVKNLVFFTKAVSRSQFWRMLGRGMRLAEGKTHFFVLDLCENFRTFGSEPTSTHRVPGSDTEIIFTLRVRLAEALQSLTYAGANEQLRHDTVREIMTALRTVNRESFSARRHVQALDHYTKAAAYKALSPTDVQTLCTTLAPLLLPDRDSHTVRSLERRILTLMLARTQNRTDTEISQTIASLREDAEMLAKRASHKKITAQKKLLTRIIRGGYLESATLTELSEIRRALRPLMRFLPQKDAPVRFSLTDSIVSLTTLTPSEV